MRILFVSLASLFLSVGASLAATLSFMGEVDLVGIDTGTSDLSGLAVGMAVSGTIDDTTFSGSATASLGTVTFDCCIAAGGLEITNDMILDASAASLINSLQSVRTFSAGDIIDLIDIEGDTDSDAGRIEVGLSLVYDGATLDSDDPSGYPAGDPLFSLFFLLQEDDEDVDIYAALGLVDKLTGLPGTDPDPDPDPDPSVIPLPAGAALLLSALAGLGAVRRRRI